jgi:hypothetical protein
LLFFILVRPAASISCFLLHLLQTYINPLMTTTPTLLPCAALRDQLDHDTVGDRWPPLWRELVESHGLSHEWTMANEWIAQRQERASIEGYDFVDMLGG